MVVVDLDKVERALDLLESEDVPQEQRYNADNYAKNNLDYILSNAKEEERELTEEEIAIIKRGEEYYNVQVLNDGRVIQKEADAENLAEEEGPKETKKNKKKKELKKNKDEKKEADNKYQKTSKKIKKHTKNLTPEDIIEQVSNAPIGTPEYKAVKEAVNKLKEINSTDRVNENALRLGVNYAQEMHRVLIHGILHLCGYEDKTQEQQQMMRRKEDYYLRNIRLDIMLED